MAVESRTKVIIQKAKLDAELAADATLAPKYQGFTLTGTDQLDIHFSSALDSGEISALDALLTAFVDETSSKPKIILYAKEEAKDKHFHNIDYKQELISSLYAKRTMVQGEITQVDWYSDVALTNKVICVEIVYVRDSIGFALSRTTTRKWINEDDTENPEFKVTNKDYTININEQLEEGQRRRKNLFNKLSLEVLGRMQVVLYQTYTPEVIVQKGRDFLLSHSIAWSEFINASHQQILTDLAVPDVINDEWLDQDMVDNVITIRDYMIQEMTLY